MKLSYSRLSVAILLGVISAASGCASARNEASLRPLAPLSSPDPAKETLSNPTGSAEAASPQDPRDFRQAVGRQSASVVSIAAIRPADTNKGSDGESMRTDLFRQSDSASTELYPPTAARVQGSGIILSDNGYILTNAHLVSGVSIINVKRVTGERYHARLVGIDRAVDVAVLKIEARNLPVATLGDPHRLKTGQWVAAIGSPFGFEQSVAVGVVSNVERILPGDDFYRPFIQTDLPLNPGNSGGPLFDEVGDVVGVNTEVVFSEDGLAGISFAIPIDLAMSVAAQLIRTGHVDRPELGIGFQDTDPQLCKAFGSPSGGVLIHTVAANGPAESAGLRVGDIVITFEGKSIGSARQFAAGIASLTPGSVATLTIWRGRGRSEVRVRTTNTSLRRPLPSRLPVQTVSPSELIVVHQLSVSARHLLRTQGYLVVMSVSDRAAAAGIEVGDVLLAVDSKPLRTKAELLQALEVGSRSVPVLIDRDGQHMFVAVSAAD